MTEDRRRLVESIFMEVSECPPESRESVLIERCADDAELLDEVRSLLAHLDQAASDSGNHAPFLDPDELRAQRGGPLSGVDDSLLPNTRIAEFTVIGKVGEGGMGIVYIAEQARPRRTVALKLIRRGLATPSMTKRFEHEAEVLGRLAHPGIAQIFEAGVAPTEQGVLPYIAMELIDGPPLTEFSGKASLPVRDRIRLIIRVCNAVQHAHQRGVIHRDLKPSNILIAGTGQNAQPKILDFGVARVVRDDRDQQMTTLHTGVGQFIGTLAYMSPEQVLAEPDQIDTRSDVYALGVILFELITGRLPLDVRAKSMPEAVRMICEDEPARLSAIDRTLRGDLDTIVAKALDKERSRRYQSAAALAEDLERFLDGRPIVAKHDSALYVIRKQMRRHRLLVVAASIFTVGLIAFGVYAGWQARVQSRLADDERRARIEADRARVSVDQKAEELRRNLYVSAIGFAQAAYASRDPDRMKRVLNSCPEDLRGWEWRYLQSIADTSSRSKPLPQYRSSVAFISADGERAASWAGDSPMLVLDGADARQIASYHVGGLTRSALFAPDHRTCVIISNTGEILIGDETAGTTRSVSGPQPDALMGLALSPDAGQILVSVTHDAAALDARLLDLKDGHVIRSLGLPVGFSGAFSSDGKWIALGLMDGGIRLCDTQGRAPDRVLRPHSNVVGAVAFSHDGSRLASGGYDGLVSVHDIASGTSTTFPVSDNKLLVLAWSPDDRLIAVSGTEPVIRIVDPARPRVISNLFGHDARLQSLAWGEHGLRSTSRDGTMRWWESPTSSPSGEREFAGGVDAACADAQGRYAFLANSSGRISVLDCSDLHTAFEIPFPAAPVGAVGCSRDGSMAAICTEAGDVLIFDVPSQRLISTFKAVKGRALDAAFDPSGTRLALGSDELALTIWDTRKGTLLVEGPELKHVPNCVAWSPDGSVIAAGQQDGTITLHDPSDGRTLMELKGHGAFCFHVRFTPDGRRLCSGDETGLMLLWNLASGTIEHRLLGHQNGVFCIEMSPDGTRLVTGGWDNTVRVWDLPEGRELLTLRGHIGGISVASFSRDGDSILSASGDGGVRLWRAEPSVAKARLEPKTAE